MATRLVVGDTGNDVTLHRVGRFRSWIRPIAEPFIRGSRSAGEGGDPTTSAWTRWLALAATILIPVVAGLFTLRQLDDFDLFWHLRTGQWIQEMHQVPLTDPFGEITAGAPWIEVPWAADVAMAVVARIAGVLGLQILAVLLVTGSFGVCLVRLPRTPLVIWAGVLAILTCWQRFLPRPDLLSLPLLIALLLLVDRMPSKRRADLAWVALLAVVWCNIHGSFVLVPVVLAATLGGELLGHRPVRHLLLALALVLVAPLATPYGARLYLVLEPYVKSIAALAGLTETQRLTLAEWRPTWQGLVHDSAFPFWPLMLLTAILVLSFARTGRQVCLSRLLSAVVLMGLGLTAVRHLLVYSISALVFIGLNERDRLDVFLPGPEPAVEPPGPGPRRGRSPWPRLAATACAAALVVLVVTAGSIVTDRYYVARDLSTRTGVGVDLRTAPEGAAVWLAAHVPPGRIFNNFDSGAYLHHRLYPNFRPYLDARLVDADLYFQVRHAIASDTRFASLVEREGIGTIVLSHPSPETYVLLPRLAADARWKLAFRDRNSTIHVRTDLAAPEPRHPPLELDPPLEPAMRSVNRWLDRLKTGVLPADYLTSALVSRMLGQPTRELIAYRRAYAIAPDNARVEQFFAINPDLRPARPER
ncbi:MAG: hypothetical protein ACE5IK_03300 [Acidobacteriota bacterium]